MFCCKLLYVHSSFAIFLIGKGELVALLSLSPLCLVMVVWLFLAVPWVCLRYVIVAFPDHTHLLFLLFNTSLTFQFLGCKHYIFMYMDEYLTKLCFSAK